MSSGIFRIFILENKLGANMIDNKIYVNVAFLHHAMVVLEKVSSFSGGLKTNIECMYHRQYIKNTDNKYTPLQILLFATNMKQQGN